MLQKGGTGPAALGASHFDKRDTGGIVDRDMGEFIPDAAGALGEVAVDTMADAADAPQRLDIDMQQVAGLGPLVALHHRRRVEPTHSIQARAQQHAGDRRSRHTHAHTDLPRRRPLLAVGEDRRGARQVQRPWLSMRTRRPILEPRIPLAGATEPLRHRAHADADGVQPSRVTRSIKSCRIFGVVLALR